MHCSLSEQISQISELREEIISLKAKLADVSQHNVIVSPPQECTSSPPTFLALPELDKIFTQLDQLSSLNWFSPDMGQALKHLCL